LNRNVKGSVFLTPAEYKAAGMKQRLTKASQPKRVPHNKGKVGKKWSAERRAKHVSRKGIPRSAETIAKTATKLRGKTKSESHRRALSDSGQWDPAIYTFIRKKDQLVFTGTRRLLTQAYPDVGLNASKFSNLIHGRVKSTCGWTLNAV
jgi:hypothetical protein